MIIYIYICIDIADFTEITQNNMFYNYFIIIYYTIFTIYDAKQYILQFLIIFFFFDIFSPILSLQR